MITLIYLVFRGRDQVDKGISVFRINKPRPASYLLKLGLSPCIVQSVLYVHVPNFTVLLHFSHHVSIVSRIHIIVLELLLLITLRWLSKLLSVYYYLLAYLSLTELNFYSFGVSN